MRDKFNQYPSRLPLDYVNTVLARLLPPVEEIRKLSGKKLFDFLKQKDELEKLIIAEPVRFFRPTPGGQWDFLTCNDPSIQGLYFFAGNKSGKTTGAAVLVAENAVARPLWAPDKRSESELLFAARKPLRICIFCEDFSTHEETIIPTLLTWLPRKEIHPRGLERGPSATPSRLFLNSGTIIFFRTYDQGYAKAEGKDYDLIWCDEPPTRDLYTAMWRGLVVTRGRLVIAATLLSEAWLYDELQQPFIKVFEGSMFDNPWIDEQGRKNFAALLTEDELEVRVSGRPSELSGKIYPGFRDASPWVLPYDRFLHDPIKEQPYPVVMGVDPHERKPLYLEWGWILPDDSIVWFDWMLCPAGSLDEVFRAIAERELTHFSETNLVVIDPNRGQAKQIDGRCWTDEFEAHGYQVLLGIDDINFGHREMKQMLFPKPREDGSFVPLMRWMDTCRGKNGPLYQMTRYGYVDPSRKVVFAKGLREKIDDRYKDFPDIHRYLAAAHLEFKLLSGRDKAVIDILAGKNGKRTTNNPYFRN
jgi:hypothetical protein